MGLISRLADLLRGPDRQAVTEMAAAVVAQFADDHDEDTKVLTPRQKSGYDRLLDKLNRLPRPLMVFGTLLLIVTAMVAPVWFADRMEALAAMPEGLWWLIGAVISLYFGSRFQAHEQSFQRDMVESIVRLPVPVPSPVPVTPRVAATGSDAALTAAVVAPSDNAALAAWQARNPQVT
jgi:hypothetical protein